MNLYLLAAAASGLFFAFSGVIYKASNKHLIKDPLRYLLVFNLTRVVILVPLLPYLRFSGENQTPALFLVYVLAFFLASVLVGLAIVYLDVSVFMPLFNLQIIFTPLFAFFFLGERFGLVPYFLMAIVLLGGFLVTFSESSRRRRLALHLVIRKIFGRQVLLPLPVESVQRQPIRPLLLLLGGLVFYSLCDVLAGRILKQWSVLNLMVANGWLQVLLSLFLIPFFRVREQIDGRKVAPIFLGGFFGFLGLLAINLGFSYNVSLSQVLSRLSSVYALALVVILARFKGDFLENHPPYVYAVRFAGAGVMVLAALGLLFI